MAMNQRLMRPLSGLQAPPGPPLPPETAAVLTTNASAGATINVSAAADFIAGNRVTVQWWDGSRTTSGSPTGSFSKVAIGGSQNFYVYRSDSAGQPTAINTLNSLDINAASVTSINLTSVDSFGMALSATGNPGLTSFTPGTCRLADINFSGAGFTTLTLSPVFGFGQSSVYLNDMAALTSLTVNSNGSMIGALHARANPSMATIRVFIESVFVDAGKTTKLFNDEQGIWVTDNNLNAAALNQLYSDLDTRPGSTSISVLNVEGNPGVGADNPAIATAKGWVVFGS